MTTTSLDARATTTQGSAFVKYNTKTCPYCKAEKPLTFNNDAPLEISELRRAGE